MFQMPEMSERFKCFKNVQMLQKVAKVEVHTSLLPEKSFLVLSQSSKLVKVTKRISTSYYLSSAAISSSVYK